MSNSSTEILWTAGTVPSPHDAAPFVVLFVVAICLLCFCIARILRRRHERRLEAQGQDWYQHQVLYFDE